MRGPPDEDMFYQVNLPKIVYEIIDGQVIIINFDNGAYFSLDGTGADVWRMIEGSASAEEIVDLICRLYEGSRGEIERSVSAFLSRLGDEGLVLMTGGRSSGSPAEDLTMSGAERPLFEAPLLTKYEDMKDLLLLDPIHEVDESGWPVSKGNSSVERKVC